MHSGGQPGGAKSLTTSSSGSQVVKSDNNAAGPTTPKGKKRERTESNIESSKRERSLDAEERDSKVDDLASILDKDGSLGTCASVEKLVQVMQQDRNDGRKPDVATKRTGLAAAVAATESHECLDRFVQLGGVSLLHDWLQEAQKVVSGDDSSKDGNREVDELLLTIVSALEKLPIDFDALKTCLVGRSVNNLRSHKNHEIKDKAKRLVEAWKKRVDEEVLNSPSDVKPAMSHCSSWSANKAPPAEDAQQQAGSHENGHDAEESDSTPTKLETAVKSIDIVGILEKDGGLSSCDSVEKLVLAMQQDRNDGDRKPLEVASKRTGLAAAIAGTDNHECLDHFVQLGGVSLLHDWLQEARDETAKEGSKEIDELLLTIVSALEKLPVDLEALKTCLVGRSVNNLRNHRNHEIKDKARRLVEAWKKRVDEEVLNSTGEMKSPPTHGSSFSANKVSPDAAAAAAAGGANKAPASVSAGKPKPLSIGKDEKSSKDEKGGSPQVQNHSQIYPKEEAKCLPASGSKRKGTSGLNSVKEPGLGKPHVLSRTGGNEKGEASAPASSHKLIVRLPNPARSSFAEAFGPTSQGSSPNIEQSATSSVVEASDTRQRSHHGPTRNCQDDATIAAASVSAAPAAAMKTEEGQGDRAVTVVDDKSKSSRNCSESLAIVPISAASRISGDARDAAGATAISEVMTGTQDVTVQEIVAECKDKETIDEGKCASSSSFTEMSVAGQAKHPADETVSPAVAGGAPEEESHAGENDKPKTEQEGLGESPEPRARGDQASSPSELQKHGSNESEKRGLTSSANASSTQRLKAPGRKNSWEEKISSYIGSGQQARGSALDSRSSSGRKDGVEPLESESNLAAEPSSKIELKRNDSSPDFVVDDALEVAQQIAMEVQQEMENFGKPLESTMPPPEQDERVQEGTERQPVCRTRSSSVEAENAPAEPLAADGAAKDDEKASAAEVQQEEALPLEVPEGGETVVTVAAEQEKPAEVAVPPVLNARPVFDLNEGVAAEECRDVCYAPGLTAPIAVLPAARGAFIVPESLMKGKTESGWKGSAATSAFRPAEPRPRLQEPGESAKEAKPSVRAPLEFDLNVAEDETAAPFTGRVAFDLNCVEECEEDKETTTGRGVARDFDLNGPTVEDVAAGEEAAAAPAAGATHMNLTASSENQVAMAAATAAAVANGGFRDVTWLPPGNSYSAFIPAFSMNRGHEQAYSVPTQPFLNAGAAGHFNMELYRGYPSTAAAAPSPFPYAGAGYPFASNYPTTFSSAASFSPYVDASGAVAAAAAAAAAAQYPVSSSQQLGAGPGGAMSRFIRPPFMGIPDAAAARPEAGWMRPSLDLNNGPDPTEGAAGAAAAVDHFRTPPGRGMQLEDHLRGLGGQVASTKRKEPDSGWEAFQQAGYKQPAWC